MIIRVSKYLVTPCISHLDHVEAEQPYLGDLLTMVVNHLLTPPSEVRVSLGAEAKIYQNFTLFFSIRIFMLGVPFFHGAKTTCMLRFFSRKMAGGCRPLLAGHFILNLRFHPQKENAKTFPPFVKTKLEHLWLVGLQEVFGGTSGRFLFAHCKATTPKSHCHMFWDFY